MKELFQYRKDMEEFFLFQEHLVKSVVYLIITSITIQPYE